MEIPITNKIDEEISVFETLRSYGGKILGLEDHLIRLEESARTLSLSIAPSRDQIRGEVNRQLQESKQGDLLIRPTVFRGGLVFFVVPVPQIKKEYYEQGVTVTTAATRLSTVNSNPVGAKSNAYGPQALSFLKAHLEAEFEVLYLDPYGFVGESRVTNIFLIKDGVLKTPRTTHILNGVTRRLVLDLAPQAGLKVEETSLTRHDFYNATECFLTNSVIEVMPIKRIDGRSIGDGNPGLKTSELREIYRHQIKNL
jgi:branched-chain amino acid aminotransferase